MIMNYTLPDTEFITLNSQPQLGSIQHVYLLIFLEIRAYDKAAIKCNGREAVTNFEPSTYIGEMILDTSNEGIICYQLLLILCL